jgi:hypothetical protein
MPLKQVLSGKRRAEVTVAITHQIQCGIAEVLIKASIVGRPRFFEARQS